jgi:hypothetical protein
MVHTFPISKLAEQNEVGMRQWYECMNIKPTTS